jgi:glucose/arabinose dehydrogenase
VAPAVGWAAGAMPSVAEGLAVTPLAQGLQHPRSLFVLPNGDVLVAESNAPADRDKPKSIRGWFMAKYFKKAGAAVPSANRITILRDRDGDGIAETRSILLHDLYSPFGMTLIGDYLYVANSDAIMRYPYRTGQLTITAPGERVTALPGGHINHHWTKSLLASPDGSRLYVSIGSNSNVGEAGADAETDRAMIWEVNPVTGAHRTFASGLRNAVGLTWDAGSNALWAAVNERDELGSDLVPDYLTRVRDGAFYGWPFVYYGNHVDKRVRWSGADSVTHATSPDYALGPHTGSLGLVSARGADLPAAYGDGMFVGQHGSWNRRPFSGYKVIFVPFANGAPTGALPADVVWGFIDGGGNARGRPVALAIDTRGALLVADDVGNTVWRVTRRSLSASR